MGETNLSDAVVIDSRPEPQDTERIHAELWQYILSAARGGLKAPDDHWTHGYRAGLVNAYALVTGQSYNEVTKALLEELKAELRAES